MINEEKRQWMEEAGIKELDRALKFMGPSGQMYSEEYLEKTPLEKIKAGFERLEGILNERNNALNLG